MTSDLKETLLRLAQAVRAGCSVFANEKNEAMADEIEKMVKGPKYDPSRPLKKGDRVQVKRRNGRCNGQNGEYLREAFCTVAEDETINELVRVLHNSTEYRLDPAYLELVTPAEEREPYGVEKYMHGWTVCKNIPGDIVAHFINTHPHAKEAAEAECARLNAEYRKEREND